MQNQRHSSACLVWAVAGSFVWTKNSIQVTEVEDSQSCCGISNALGLAVKILVLCVMILEIHSLYNTQPQRFLNMGII